MQNKFAMIYLISDDDIKEVIEYQYTPEMLVQLWGYKKELIELRIKNFIWRCDVHEIQKNFIVSSN